MAEKQSVYLTMKRNGKNNLLIKNILLSLSEQKPVVFKGSRRIDDKVNLMSILSDSAKATYSIDYNMIISGLSFELNSDLIMVYNGFDIGKFGKNEKVYAVIKQCCFSPLKDRT